MDVREAIETRERVRKLLEDIDEAARCRWPDVDWENLNHLKALKFERERIRRIKRRHSLRYTHPGK